MQFELTYPNTESVIDGITVLYGLPRICFEHGFRVIARNGASPISYINLIPRSEEGRKPCTVFMNTRGEFGIFFDDGGHLKGDWFTLLDAAARTASIDVLAFVWPRLVVQQKLTARRFAALQKAGLTDFAQWSDHRACRASERRFAWERGRFVGDVDVGVDDLVAEMERVGEDPVFRKQPALRSLFVAKTVPERWRNAATRHWIEGSATEARDYIQLKNLGV